MFSINSHLKETFMTSAFPLTTHQKEISPGYDGRAVYIPFVWLAMWVIRFGQRAGFISVTPQAPPSLSAELRINLFRNRRVRRAKISCLRRMHRHRTKGTYQHPSSYMPRAYRFMSFVSRMDQSITPAQFNEHYLRANNMSRVEIYGIDSAHRIVEFVPGLVTAAIEMMSALTSAFGLSNLSLAAPTDPAPP